MMLRLASSGVDPGSNVAPSAIIERLLLHPNQVRIRVLVEVGRDQVVRERRELLDPAYGDVFDASLFTGLCEGKVDLACGEKY